VYPALEEMYLFYRDYRSLIGVKDFISASKTLKTLEFEMVLLRLPEFTEAYRHFMRFRKAKVLRELKLRIIPHDQSAVPVQLIRDLVNVIYDDVSQNPGLLSEFKLNGYTLTSVVNQLSSPRLSTAFYLADRDLKFFTL
jgi:hypothetical protein